MSLCDFVTYKDRCYQILLCYFSFSGLLPFIEGRCPGSKAPIFNQSNFFVSAPKVNINGSSFTISCWIKQTKWSDMGVIYGDWYYPLGYLLLSAANQSIVFYRQSTVNNDWWSLQTTNLSLIDWTHVVVTWHHVTRNVAIYANGKEVGKSRYSPNETFYEPTGKRFMIGNDGRAGDHQFHGSVMDLYVFDEALLLDEINVIRGVGLIAFPSDKY